MQKSILEKKEFKEGFYRPVLDDYFFSLLYHCTVHKHSIKNTHIERLSRMRKKMNFDWFDINDLMNNKKMGFLLSGYMKANNYFYEQPLDRGVYINYQIVKYLPQKKLENHWNRLFELFKAAVLRPHKVPKCIVKYTIMKIKQFKKRGIWLL